MLWVGYRESRKCSRDTYPESYITKYTSIRILVFRVCRLAYPGGACHTSSDVPALIPLILNFFFFFFFTLVSGPRRSLSHKRSDTRVYGTQIRARLGTPLMNPLHDPAGGASIAGVGARVEVNRREEVYRGTLLIKNSLLLGPYGRPMHRALRWS